MTAPQHVQGAWGRHSRALVRAVPEKRRGALDNGLSALSCRESGTVTSTFGWSSPAGPFSVEGSCT